jgi:hypothetical protein
MKKFILSLSAIVLSITGFTQQAPPLNQQEKDAILYMREEEKLARDVYDSMYTKWGVNPFGNIRQSEQTHMDRMKTLITTYKLTGPVDNNKDKPGVFTNTMLHKYYNELVTAGSQSLTEALKAGAKIEELDIADLDKRIKQTKQAGIISTYSFLKRASENHLRAFVRRLKMQNINYEPVILNKAEFDKIIAEDNNKRGNGGKWN